MQKFEASVRRLLPTDAHVSATRACPCARLRGAASDPRAALQLVAATLGSYVGLYGLYRVTRSPPKEQKKKEQAAGPDGDRVQTLFKLLQEGRTDKFNEALKSVFEPAPAAAAAAKKEKKEAKH
jgi:hypothetical protein